MQTGVGQRGHDASSPTSCLLSTVETGVGATAAFLISGRGLCNTKGQKEKKVSNTVEVLPHLKASVPPVSVSWQNFVILSSVYMKI